MEVKRRNTEINVCMLEVSSRKQKEEDYVYQKKLSRQSSESAL
jgi:hypothetical protein